MCLFLYNPTVRCRCGKWSWVTVPLALSVVQGTVHTTVAHSPISHCPILRVNAIIQQLVPEKA